ncbi:YncE family protein [Sulfurimonas marina]|uniref:WD40 repeat domain-containing protein n=1 Tax=Sulfurimonas marina TaxID=2590551 RepID=A0A7M3V9E3_9BACT|nr:WD40 repeat domain-containing protein [Sulfurimonas marina]QOP40376.1 WD40 repeat domain-containing protein [Sulfurimonas marina]
MKELSLHLCRSVVASAYTGQTFVIIDSTPTFYTYDKNALFESHSKLQGFATYINRYSHNITLSHDGAYALLCDTKKNRILLIDMQNKKLKANIPYSKAPNFALFNQTSEYFIISNSVGNITIYNTDTLAVMAQLNIPDELRTVTFSDDDSKIAIAAHNKKVYIFSVETQKLLETITFDEIVEVLSFSKENTTLLTFSRKGNVTLYSLVHKKMYSAAPRSQWPSTLAHTQNKEVVLVGTRGSQIDIYTTSRGNKLGTLHFDYWGVTSIYATNECVLVGFSDGNCIILNIQEEIQKAQQALDENRIGILAELCYMYPLLFINPEVCALINEKYKEIFSFKAQSDEQALGYDALISFIIENDTKKQELLTFIYQSNEIVSFMQEVECGNFDGACENTYKFPVLRQLREFSEFRTICHRNVSEEIELLEKDPNKFTTYREEKTHNCTACIYKILTNEETLKRVYVDFKKAVQAKNYTTMLDLATKFPSFKQTRLYRRVMSYGEALIDKILLMMQSDHIEEATKYAVMLSKIKPFEKTGLDFKEQITHFMTLEQASKKDDVLKVFDLAEKNPAFRTTKAFQQQLQNYQNKYSLAKVQALKGDVAACKIILGDYFKVEHFKEKNLDILKIALLHEIKHFSPKESEKKFLDKYHEYFGWDEMYDQVCTFLQHTANTIKKLTPVETEYKELQTLIEGEKVKNKVIKKKENKSEM